MHPKRRSPRAPGNAKLTATMVRGIRTAWRVRPPEQHTLAAFTLFELNRLQRHYGITLSAQAIYEIVQGRTWANLS